jgi:tetratricopeptide (TPR) repeat protein
MPRGKVQSSTRLLSQVGQQVLHRRWPGRYVGRLADQEDVQRDLSRGYEKLVEVYTFSNQVVPIVCAVFSALNTAEAVGPCPELARGYASVGAMMGLVPLHGAARAYLQRALDVAQSVDDLAVQSHTALYAGLYYAGVGDWARTEELWTRASENSERLGDHRAWESCIGNRAIASYLRGDFEAGLELANQAYQLSCQRNVSFFQATALNLKAGLWLSLGHVEQAMACLERARALVAEHPDIVDVTMESDICALQLNVDMQQEQYPAALDRAQRLEDLLVQLPIVQIDCLPRFASLAEARLTLWEMDDETPDGKKLAHRACKYLDRYARIFPIGRPRAWLRRGQYQWLSGKSARAHPLWRKSLAVAQELAMPYERGLAHYEIGRHLDPGDPERRVHLERAIDLFRDLGAGPARERAQAALDA